MRLRVRRVVVLIRLPRASDLALQPRRHRVVRTRILRVDVCRAHDHLGTERLQRVDLLLRLLVRRREDAAIALDRRNDGQAHAGVAGRPLDDGAARLELTAALGILDHAEGDAVLDRVARVEGLDLGQDRGLGHIAGDAR